MDFLDPLGGRDGVGMEDASVQAFERVYEVTHRLLSSCDLRDTIAAIVDVAVEWVGAHYASVILLDDQGRIAYEVENLSNIKPLSKRIRARGITSRIVSSGKPVFVPDTLDHQETNPELRKSGVRSYVGMPLTVDECVRAVLYVYSTEVTHSTTIRKCSPLWPVRRACNQERRPRREHEDAGYSRRPYGFVQLSLFPRETERGDQAN